MRHQQRRVAGSVSDGRPAGRQRVGTPVCAASRQGRGRAAGRRGGTDHRLAVLLAYTKSRGIGMTVCASRLSVTTTGAIGWRGGRHRAPRADPRAVRHPHRIEDTRYRIGPGSGRTTGTLATDPERGRSRTGDQTRQDRRDCVQDAPARDGSPDEHAGPRAHPTQATPETRETAQNKASTASPPSSTGRRVDR